MSDIVIQIENLSKLYRLGVISTGTISHDLNRWWAKLRGRPDPAFRVDQASKNENPSRSGDEYIWALKNLSFEVKQGEVLGIIGRNGAGKSTLLKILSRVTAPTTGECRVKGRIASLLEVGTGFHQELTGRENIFLNGAILGMTKEEIRRKFDEIVAFSGVENYIDTPVKRYSSGMYVRLAFAVAAHLEPEILIIDEVLAVGDAAFQKKCLGKMGDVAREGRTVLFVSHNMGAVTALCETALILNGGRAIGIGPVTDITTKYLSSLYEASQYSLQDRKDRGGTGKARINCIYLAGKDGEPLQEVLSGYECTLVMGYESTEELNNPTFKFTVYNSIGQPLVQFDSSLTETSSNHFPLRGSVGCRLQRLPLSRGMYRLNVSIEDNGQLLDHVIGAYNITVIDGNFHGIGRNIEGLKEVCLADQEWLLLDKALVLTKGN